MSLSKLSSLARWSRVSAMSSTMTTLIGSASDQLSHCPPCPSRRSGGDRQRAAGRPSGRRAHLSVMPVVSTVARAYVGRRSAARARRCRRAGRSGRPRPAGAEPPGPRSRRARTTDGLLRGCAGSPELGQGRENLDVLDDDLDGGVVEILVDEDVRIVRRAIDVVWPRSDWAPRWD